VEELASVDHQDTLGLLEQLPPAQRAAVRSRVMEEQEYSEIARRLRCSELVVRQRVSRGLARLQRDMEAKSNE
jgi:RNA polymerase sigma-70 factor (ECF subfamily)